MRIFRLIVMQICLLVVVAALIHGLDNAATRPNPDVDPARKPSTSVALVTFDVRDPPDFVFNPGFRQCLTSHTVPNGWRVAPSNSAFDDSLPKFKALLADPSRKGDNWIIVEKGGKVVDSEALPATEAKAEKIIMGYAK